MLLDNLFQVPASNLIFKVLHVPGVFYTEVHPLFVVNYMVQEQAQYGWMPLAAQEMKPVLNHVPKMFGESMTVVIMRTSPLNAQMVCCLSRKHKCDQLVLCYFKRKMM